MVDKDPALLDDIVEHAEEALLYLEGVTVEEFGTDRRLQLQIERLMEIIGEAAGGLSASTRAEIEFEWRAVRGLRNVISHQYGFIDRPKLYATAKNQLPRLLKGIREYR